MKLKTKLISIIAPAALITTVAPIALTSCSGDGQSTEYVKYNGEKTHSSINTSWVLEFTLTKALESNQTLKVSFAKAGSLWINEPTISGTKVTVEVTHLGLPGTSQTFDLNFKCYTAPSTVVTTWEQKIEGFTFTKSA